MAGTKDSSNEKPDDVGKERWERARRDDLADAIGLIVSPPSHAVDSSGQVKFGLRPTGGIWDPAVSERYIEEVEKIIRYMVRGSEASEGNTEGINSNVTADRYSVGPAAQEWPKYLFLLWEHGKTVLENAVLLYGAGQMIQSIVKKLRRHDVGVADDRTRSVNTHTQEMLPFTSVEGTVLLTPGALVSLCVMDLHDRYEPIGDVDVEIHTRSWSEYSTQGHPGLASDVHLVRVQLGKRSLFWSVQTDGRLLDHFQLVGDRLTQLPEPRWFEGDERKRLSFRTEREGFYLNWKGIFG